MELKAAFYAGMRYKFYDENGDVLYSQTVNVGTIYPEQWGKLQQTFTAPTSGLMEVEIFNYNQDAPVFFDDWHIVFGESNSPEIVQEMHYDPWGLPMQEECYSTPNDTDFTFNGKELQTFADLYLYDYHWRQYDPQLGRWHSTDPADQFHGISGYAYCANNPVMLTDPDGREFVTLATIAVVAFISTYVSSGVSTGDWGWSSVGKGAISAGLAILGAGLTHTITTVAMNAGASSTMASLLGKTASSLIVSGISGQNAFRGLAYTYTAGLFNGASAVGQYGGNALVSGTLGGIFEEADGGSFGNGFLQGAASSIVHTAIGRIANKITTYISQERARQKAMEAEYGLSEEDHMAYLREKPVGDLMYCSLEGGEAEFKAMQAKYDTYKGYIGDLKRLDGFKVGRIHVRYTSKEKFEQLGVKRYGFNIFGAGTHKFPLDPHGRIGMPLGISIHYDKYDVAINPLIHYWKDTRYQGKFWGRQ